MWRLRKNFYMLRILFCFPFFLSSPLLSFSFSSHSHVTPSPSFLLNVLIFLLFCTYNILYPSLFIFLLLFSPLSYVFIPFILLLLSFLLLTVLFVLLSNSPFFSLCLPYLTLPSFFVPYSHPDSPPPPLRPPLRPPLTLFLLPVSQHIPFIFYFSHLQIHTVCDFRAWLFRYDKKQMISVST